jgi:RHS repeat-associated protein
LVSRTAGGSTNWYTFDPQGNTALIYQSVFNFSNPYVSDAYGNLVSGTSAVPYDGFGAQYGDYHDPTTGWYLMGHRFYAPGQGRFVNRDPMGYGGGINQFGYVGNDPMNGADPSGFDRADNSLINIITDPDAGPQDDKYSTSDMSARDPDMVVAGFKTANMIGQSTPGVGTMLFGYDAITGCDAVMNHEIPLPDRVLDGVLAVASLIPGAGEAEGPVRNELGMALNDFLPALKKYAPNSKDYRDLGLDPYAKDFPDQLLNAMNNADGIHFNLDGMNGIPSILNDDPSLNPVGSTNWELRTIMDNPSLLGKTTLWRGGKQIGIGDIF